MSSPEIDFIEYGPVPSQYFAQASRLAEYAQRARDEVVHVESDNALDEPYALAVLIAEVSPLTRVTMTGEHFHTGWAIRGFAGRENNEGDLKPPIPEVITHAQAGYQMPKPGEVLVMVKKGAYVGPNTSVRIIKPEAIESSKTPVLSKESI